MKPSWTASQTEYDTKHSLDRIGGQEAGVGRVHGAGGRKNYEHLVTSCVWVSVRHK